MKTKTLILCALLLFPVTALADNWFPTGSPTALTPVVPAWGLKIPSISGSTQCLHANSSGVVTGTGSDCGSGGGSGTVGAGTTGQFPYYAANGTALTATSTLFLAQGGAVGVGLSSPGSVLEIQGTSTASTGNAFIAWDSSASNLFDIRNDGNVGISSSSPDATLGIAGTGHIAGTAATPLTLERTSSNTNYNMLFKGGATSLYAGGTGSTFVVGSAADLSTAANRFASFSNTGASLYESGVAKVTLGSTGLLGIGTTSPNALLTISQTGGSGAWLRSSNDGISGNGATGFALGTTDTAVNGTTVIFAGTSGSQTHIPLYFSVSGSDSGATPLTVINGINRSGDLVTGTASAVSQRGILDVENNSTSLLRVTASGNIGISTSSPLSTLAVSGNGSIGADYNIAAPTNGLIVEGNVGIGTSSPATRLDIEGTTVAPGITPTGSLVTILSNSAQLTDRGGTLGLGGAFNAAGTQRLFGVIAGLKENSTGANQAGYLSLSTNNNGTMVEGMRLTSAGNVGIGSTTPTASLSVVAASTTAGTVQTNFAGMAAILGGLENATYKAFFGIDQWGFPWSSGDQPTVTGGTSSLNAKATDSSGHITVVGTLLTSVTLNFAHTKPSAPNCTISDSSTGITAGVTSISATQLVVGFSAGVNTGDVWYICQGND